MAEDVQDNINRILDKIEAAKQKNSIRHNVTLMAVSKRKPVSMIRQAYDAGIRVFGENRIQEAQEKIPQLSDCADIEWHMIGHLQKNKAKIFPPLFCWLDSVDKLATADAVNKYLQAENKTVNILIEVKTTDEITKSGCDENEVPELINALQEYEFLTIRGFLTISPFNASEKEIRKSFTKCREISMSMKKQFPNLNLDTLSMGMSDDFEIAIEEGSNMVRLGTTIFGTRE